MFTISACEIVIVALIALGIALFVLSGRLIEAESKRMYDARESWRVLASKMLFIVGGLVLASALVVMYVTLR